MHHNIHRCHSLLLLFLLVTIILACICASSAQSTGRDKPYFVSTIAGNGTGVNPAQPLKVNVPALEARFGVVFGFAQSTKGDFYVVARTFSVVLKFEFNRAEGTWSDVTVIAGTGVQGYGANNVVGTQSALNGPVGVSLIEDSSTGEVTSILIAEWNLHRIRQLDMSTRIITTIAGKGVNYGFSGDGGSPTAALLNYPRGVYYDKSNRDIYIVDSWNHRIRRVRGGTISTVVGKECVDSDGLGDGGRAVDACLRDPYSFTMNNAGEWFIADRDNHRIRKVYLNGTITTVAGGGTETGDAPATSVKLSDPFSIAFTSSGEMIVADYGSKVIRKVDNSGFMKVIAGGGSKAPSSNNPISAKTANIWPVAIITARDGSDALFVSGENGSIFKLSNLTRCHGVENDNSAVCSGHGTCIDLDECECDDGWTGHDCSVAYCFDVMSDETSVCSGHGSCIGIDQCVCNDGWTGHDCSVAYCFDVMSNETSMVCSGHGLCIAPDNCTCDDGWIESDCSVPNIFPCFGISSNDTSVCSSHGSCVGVDECKCDKGWMGIDCSITHCFGVTSNVPDLVCSGKGKCVNHNKCKCDDGYRGHRCHHSK